MANTIRIKRRPSTGSAGAPSSASLYNGELAFNENDNTLYYAYGSGVNGISQSVPAIAGSGAYALRGGTNATGTWPISVNGNAAYATNAVYTTGNQTVNGDKTLKGILTVEDIIRINGSGTGASILLDHDSGNSVGLGTTKTTFNAIFNGYNKDVLLENGTVGEIAIESNFGKVRLYGTSGILISDGGNGTGVEISASTTSSSGTHFAAFTSYSNGGVIKARTAAQVKGDIGLSNVTNDIQVKQTTGGTTIGYLPTWNSTSGELLAAGYAVSTNLVTNSGSTHIPRADSVVNYVSSGLANHVHGNITNDGKIGSTANLPLITTTNGTITTGSFGSTANTFCQGNDSRLSDTRNTTNSITVNNGGAGDSSSFTFNGSAAKTISYNSVGAPSQTGALASGSNWNISILGNSATVTNGVYTSRTLNAGSGLVGGGDLSSDRTFNIGQGDGMSISADSIAVDNTVVRTTGGQTIGGIKTFNSQVNISGNLGQYLLFRSTNAGNYANIVFDGNNYDAAAQSSYIISNTGNMEIAHGQKIQLNSALEVKAANTAGNSVGYFAVFDSNPNSSLTTLKSVSKDQILDDIGAATSGLNITAGSGLVGGGTLSTDRRFDIGQGDGITVSADSIAVDSTVVRTTGTQTINGSKTFGNTTTFNSGISIGDPINYLTGTALIVNYGDGGGYLASFVNGTTWANSSIKLNANTTFDRPDNAGALPFIINPTGYAGSGAVTQGFWRGETIEVNKGGTGRTSYSNGQLLIGSGTSLAANTLTQGSNIQITNGSGTITIAATGLALSSRTLTAGSGLVGGGDLSSDKTFDIGQGDGISVSADSIAVDSTVVRSTSVNVSGYIPTWAANSSKTLNVGYQVSTSLDTNNSSSFIPRADAVKTYVDSMIGSGIATNDAMIFKGAIDCSTNPNYPAADRGWTYKVSVAGKIGGASGPAVEVNDTLICTTDGTSAGTHASVGSNWVILQTNIADASILVTGPTSATSGNIALFDGTTGKIIKDAGFAATTVGQNLVSLTNPSAITFLKVNANNTVSTESASTYRTSLGANTIGSNIFTLTNPSAISFLRINADNTVTARSASELKTDLSLNNVENTALSTWAGSTNITTLGTIGTGTWNATTIAVNKGGTGQTSYTDGQLLIGNSTGNTLTKATLTQGTAIDITNGGGSITIGHNDTSTLTGAQGSNGIASFTVDGMGHVTAVTTATYLTSGQSLCDAISNSNCTIDGGTF